MSTSGHSSEPHIAERESGAAPLPTRRRVPSHVRILIGLLIGAIAGCVANRLAAVPTGASSDPAGEPIVSLDADGNGVHDRLDWWATNAAEPVGKVFLRLMFMVVIPLVFSALTLGVVGLGDVRHLGRVGLRTLALTVTLSVLAVGIGVTLVNVIRPGSGLTPAQRDSLRAQFADRAGKLVQDAKQAKGLKDTLLDVIPENPLQEMVGAIDGSSKGNGMLAVMFFSLCFGAALTVIADSKRDPIVNVLSGVFDACMAVIGFAMRLAPYAVACLVFSVTARLGVDILRSLLWFAGTVTLGLGIQLFVVYALAVRLLAGMRPRAFFGESSEALWTALGTSSSNATLPTALRVAKERLKLPPAIANFVLTVGATGNQNGTALYEGVVVLFLAQVFGVELSLGQQFMVVLMSILAGVGTAGVPGGSLPLIVIVLQSVQVPAEGIALILGIDRILDMLRTVLNVAGDLAIATCVGRAETAER